MTKTVFGSHSQTAHIWAQGRHDHGRASDGRVFFQGRVLYSYGTHFALGIVILGAQGEPVLTLLNDSGYSPSTGKHKGHARHAARGRIVYVPDLTTAVYGIERATGEGMTPAKAKAMGWPRTEVESHIVKHAAAYTDESAAVVWGLMGGTEKQAQAMRAKALAKVARAQEKAAREERAALVAQGKRFAAMGAIAFRRHALGAIGESSGSAWDDSQVEAKRIRLGKELHAAHRALSAAKLTKAKRAVWAHIQTVRAMEGQAVKAARLAKARGDVRAAMSVLRQYLGEVAKPESARSHWPWSRNVWDTVGTAAHTLARHIQGQPSKQALAAALLALSDDSQVKAREAAELAARARLEEEREAREAWQAATPGARYSGRTAMGGAFLRAVNVERSGDMITGGELQTSQGAAVPLTHALKAFRFIKLCRAQGQAWAANGRTVPVGHFRIDRIAANGDFHAGCHFIEWAQVEALALALGVADWQGDESAVVTREHA